MVNIYTLFKAAFFSNVFVYTKSFQGCMPLQIPANYSRVVMLCTPVIAVVFDTLWVYHNLAVMMLDIIFLLNLALLLPPQQEEVCMQTDRSSTCSVELEQSSILYSQSWDALKETVC